MSERETTLARRAKFVRVIDNYRMIRIIAKDAETDQTIDVLISPHEALDLISRLASAYKRTTS